jgi:hypothetical protein
MPCILPDSSVESMPNKATSLFSSALKGSTLEFLISICIMGKKEA